MTEEQLAALVTPRFDDRRCSGDRAMNGVHDMGGMHGLGPLVPEPNEPVWHAPWEARVSLCQPRSAPGGVEHRCEPATTGTNARRRLFACDLLRKMDVRRGREVGRARLDHARGSRNRSGRSVGPQSHAAADRGAGARDHGAWRVPTTRAVERQPTFRVGDRSGRGTFIRPRTPACRDIARDKPGVITALHGAHVSRTPTRCSRERTPSRSTR